MVYPIVSTLLSTPRVYPIVSTLLSTPRVYPIVSTLLSTPRVYPMVSTLESTPRVSPIVCVRYSIYLELSNKCLSDGLSCTQRLTYVSPELRTAPSGGWQSTCARSHPSADRRGRGQCPAGRPPACPARSCSARARRTCSAGAGPPAPW